MAGAFNRRRPAMTPELQFWVPFAYFLGFCTPIAITLIWCGYITRVLDED